MEELAPIDANMNCFWEIYYGPLPIIGVFAFEFG